MDEDFHVYIYFLLILTQAYLIHANVFWYSWSIYSFVILRVEKLDFILNTHLF